MRRRAAAGLLALLLGGGGLLLTQPRPAAPTTDSAEAQFVRHMIVHHEQALGLSAPMLRRSGDRSLRSVALDITLGQEEQLRQMRAWLAGWGFSPGRAPPQRRRAAWAWPRWTTLRRCLPSRCPRPKSRSCG
ncbi:DUF305 domain-containing protein [Deinococcus multiflagellatus]|uniref:DUF305 domain-containing protein n=1 Tax=Deinococcus multiflagellatus TaxID=1656887 RepID=A0ABW1ZFB0_9DEIO